jgi:adenosylmethionine-8-amino-7-oxononanoate aminotransferase
VFIADEVVTAFGRLGHYFASEAVFGAEVRGSLGYLC